MSEFTGTNVPSMNKCVQTRLGTMVLKSDPVKLSESPLKARSNEHLFQAGAAGFVLVLESEAPQVPGGKDVCQGPQVLEEGG